MSIILRARPVRWVSLRPCTAYSAEPASSAIPTLARTRGPGALEPGSINQSINQSERIKVTKVTNVTARPLVACHRFKRTQVDRPSVPARGNL